MPRRLDEERPATLRPGTQATADVRTLNLQPRSFRTRFGGLFFFVPLLNNIRLTEVLRQADLPSSQMIPAEQAQKIVHAVGKNATLAMFENGNHVCNNIPFIYRPLTADWLKEKLG